MYLLCQKKGDTTSKVVAEACGLERVFPWELNVFGDGVVYNWGSAVGSPEFCDGIYNHPPGVVRAVNKRACFEFAKRDNLPTVPFTTSHAKAKEWWDAGKTVYCRVLSSSSGAKGLVVANQERNVPLKKAPLYTLFRKFTQEVRVFCSDPMHNSPSLVLVKRRMSQENLAAIGLEQADYWVRNMDRGWVYLLPEANQVAWCETVAKEAQRYLVALGLDYGAVDVGVVLDNGYKSHRLIEVNTAPGLKREETIRWVKDTFAAIREEDLV